MTTTTVQDLIDGVQRLDPDELGVLQDAVTARRKYLRSVETSKALSVFKPGDKVRLRDLMPKYVVGTTGEIVKRDGAKFVVKIDDSADIQVKHRFGSEIRVPAGCLTLVESS